jgi:MFS family permease
MIAVVFFAVGIPISAVAADRYGARRVSMIVAILIFAFGLVFAPLFMSASLGALPFLSLGMLLIGFTYGPLGTALAQLFPTAVRYTGASLAFNLAGILGASLAPYIATWLAKTYGLQYVGYYLSISAALTFVAVYFSKYSEIQEN